MFEETIISNDFVTLSLKDFLIRLVVSLGIGLVLGLEREHAGMRDQHNYFAGIRTFTIVALFGFLSGLLSAFIGIWIIYLSFTGLIVMTAVSYVVSSKKGDVGATTEFALIVSFLLGLIAWLGYVQIAIAITVVILALLSLKLEMKKVAESTTRAEIFALLKFTVLVALILPFLPDKTIDPYNVFNPREVMLVIILTSGLNFAGYLLTKFLGAKGILLTGIVGGLVSSTIITWNFSKRSKDNTALSKSYSSAILFASAIMPVRVILWIYIFNRTLLADLALPLALLIVTAFTYAFILMKKNSDDIADNNILRGNPLDLMEALKFGAIFTMILYFVHFAILYLGSKGILLASAISALSDVDAITISLAKIRDQSVSSLFVSSGILLATLSNTVVKLIIALLYGSRELKKYVIAGYGIIFFAGLAGFIMLKFL